MKSRQRKCWVAEVKTRLQLAFWIASALVQASILLLTACNEKNITLTPSLRSTEWIQVWGNSQPVLPYDLDITVDDKGIYITGGLWGTVDFHPGKDLNLQGPYGNNNCDAYLTAFKPDGSYQWTKTWGGPGGYNTYGSNVVTDNQGNIYVSGSFGGKVDFNPGPEEAIHESEGNRDWEFNAYLSKFDYQGELVWVQTWPFESCESYSIDSDGNIYIGGFTNDKDELTQQQRQEQGIDNSFLQPYVMKFDTEGTAIWTIIWEIGNYDKSLYLSTDNDGNTYVCGYAGSGEYDFDPSNGIARASVTDSSMYLVKINENGDCIWTLLDDDNNMLPCSMVVSPDKSIVILSRLITERIESQIETDQLKVTKVSPEGNIQWQKTYGNGLQSLLGYPKMCTNNDNKIFISGTFGGELDFTDGSESFSLDTSDVSDHSIFILTLSDKGDIIDATELYLMPSIDNQARGIVADTYGSIYITGVLGMMDFLAKMSES